MKITQALMMTAMAICFAMPAMAADAMMKSDTTMKSNTMMKKGDMNSHWAMMDTNGDGMISKDEWMAAAQKKFDEIDTNKDGNISKDEWAAKGKMMKHKMSKTGSTSTPAANNEAIPPKAPAAGGADGSGGPTAQ